MGKFESAFKNSTYAFNGLMVLGFLGIVWLMVYGNLSTNMGFSQTSTSFINETITLNDTGGTPATALDRTDGTLSGIIMTQANGSIGWIIESGNYTVSGVVISLATTTFNQSDVNISATVTHDTNTDRATEAVIANLTQGAGTFFGFSNTLFTIVAIVLLITILLALLYIVLGIVKMTKKGGGGFA